MGYIWRGVWGTAKTLQISMNKRPENGRDQKMQDQKIEEARKWKRYRPENASEQKMKKTSNGRALNEMEESRKTREVQEARSWKRPENGRDQVVEKAIKRN